jgi:ferric-dicitrate binding protein FerR (iron transport regulator)
MKRDEMLLRTAVQALQADEPEAAQVAASARRVADRLRIDTFNESRVDAITSCDDVQHLFGSYRAGTLSSARSLLVEAHIRDCSVCRRQFKCTAGAAVLDWSAPKARRVVAWHPQTFGWALASAFALLVTFLFVYKAYWQVPPGVRAEVQSIDGSAYRISGAVDRPLSPGETLGEGDILRTSGGGHAVLRLADGSTVEVNERSVVGVGARGHNMTVTLQNGAVIVQAAKRTSGHLYVKTPDCRVAVTGTVFSVNAGLKGSRVAVLQGTVHVLHAGIDTLATAGNQVTTNDNLSPEPVSDQIAWSHDRDKYLVLLSQFAALRQQIEQIPFPQPRYSSDLLSRVPANTTLYISVPNLGDFLSEANQTFHDQLKQSPALQEWWNSGHASNTADLDALVEKIHQMSQYLGDEVVIVGARQAKTPGFAIIADVKRGGLDDFLNKQFPASNSMPGITVLDQNSLNTAKAAPAGNRGGYAVVREHEAIFSNSIASLALINAQLNAGTSGFATSGFGQQISAAYGRGAGIILAADLHQMIGNQAKQMHASERANQAMEMSGIENMSYLIAEHRELNGQPENRVDLQFSGARKGVVAWLAAPAPIGSLNFVTPNAAIAVAALSKDPKAIADDLIAMAVPQGDSQQNGFTEAEEKLQISLRDDLAANLGGDFLLSLDGPVLPTPSWKAVIEVNDSDRLEQTLERMTAAIRQQAPANAPHSITIEPSDAGGQRYYSVQDTVTGNTVAQYTYADGYMIVAPSRVLLIQALQTYSTGNSLANSAAFKALLPKDANENYSAVAYQNLSPVLTPLLTQLNGDTADAVRKLAADARPTAICVRGEVNRIEAASDSRLFGFDFLTLETLIHSGNKHANASVRD